MRYIEYVYLMSGGMILIFLLLEHQWMSTGRIYSFGLAIIVCSCMFVLRRRRRLRSEAQELAELQAFEDAIDSLDTVDEEERAASS